MGRSLKSEVALNYIYIGLTNIISIFLTPILLREMGDAVYGLYALAFSIMTFFTLADFGVGITLIGRIAKYRMENDREGLLRYLFQMFFLYLVFALAVTAVCIVVSFLYPNVLREQWTSAQRLLLRNLLLMMSAGCFLSFFQNYYFSILIGFGRFNYGKLCGIVRVALRFALLSFFLRRGAGVRFIVLVDVLLTVLTVAAYILYVRILGIRLRRTAFEWATARRTLLSMLTLYAMPMLDNSYWVICSTFVAARLDPLSVSRFAIALVFMQVFNQLCGTISHLRLTRIAELETNSQHRPMQDYLLRTGGAQASFFGLVLVGFAVFGQMFLSVWLEGDYTVSYRAALVVMAVQLLPGAQSILDIVLYAKNKYMFRTVIIAAQVVCNTLLLIPMIGQFGLMGVAYSVAITIFIFNFVGMSFCYRHYGIEVGRYNRRVILQLFPAILCGTGTGFLVGHLTGWSLPGALFGVAAAALIYGGMVILTYSRTNLKTR